MSDIPGLHDRIVAESKSAGKAILSALKEEGLDTGGISILPSVNEKGEVWNKTAQYVAVNDSNKDLVLAMADMSIYYTKTNLVRARLATFNESRPKWIVVDGNWTGPTIRTLMGMGKSANAKVAFEPVSVVKSTSLFQPSTLNKDDRITTFPEQIVDLATPNQHELAAMHAAAKQHEFFESERWWTVIDSLGIPSSGARDRFVSLTSREMTDQGIPLQTIQLLPYIPTILTKLGSEGVLLTELLKPDDERLTDPIAAPYILSRSSNGSADVGGVYMRLFPAVEVVENVVSVNGVGDTFLGVLIAGLAKGLKLDERLINVAQRGAVMTLKSKEAVSIDIGLLKEELDSFV